MNHGTFTHDFITYRLITYFSQIFAIISVGLKLSPFVVLKSFVVNQAIIYLIFPLYFTLRYLRSKDSFYLCPLFLFCLLYIGTDSFLVNVANVSSMFSWLLFDFLRQQRTQNYNTLAICLISIIIMFGYEMGLLMTSVSLAYLLLLIKRKKLDYNKHIIIQIIFLVSSIAFNFYVAFSSISIDINHSGQFLNSFITLPTQQGVFIAVGLLYFLIKVFNNKTFEFLYLLISMAFLLFFYNYLPNNILESSGISGDAFHLRTMILPVSTLIAIYYIVFNITPSLKHIAIMAVTLSSFSIAGSIQHYSEIQNFKNLLSNIDGCLIFKKGEYPNKHGFSDWNLSHRSVAYSKTRRVEKLITLNDHSETNCYSNIIHAQKPINKYFIVD
jgi:hypothetical protein